MTTQKQDFPGTTRYRPRLLSLVLALALIISMLASFPGRLLPKSISELSLTYSTQVDRSVDYSVLVFDRAVNVVDPFVRLSTSSIARGDSLYSNQPRSIRIHSSKADEIQLSLCAIEIAADKEVSVSFDASVRQAGKGRLYLTRKESGVSSSSAMVDFKPEQSRYNVSFPPQPTSTSYYLMLDISNHLNDIAIGNVEIHF